MRYTGERVVPGDLGVGAHVLVPHVNRYAWALPQVYGKRVVDLGCGCGYGTAMLSWGAASALGVDVSTEAIQFAWATFGDAYNLMFEIRDLERHAIPPAEIYIAFEVLEHIDDPGRLLGQLEAPLLWSIPLNDASRFHRRAYSLDDITALMGQPTHYQDRAGQIAAVKQAGFAPVYALGVWEP